MTEEELPARTGKKKRTLRHGLLWSFMGSSGQAIIQFAVVVFISRLLTPAELGVTTAAIAVTAFSQLMSQMGVAPAIIQRPTITPAHMATGFIASVASGILQTIAVALFAPLLATLFGLPASSQDVFRVVSAVFVLNAFSRVAMSGLRRELHFDVVVRAELAGNMSYAILSIVLAYMGFGVWSVAYGLIAQALIQSVMLLAAERLPKPFRFDREAYRDLMTVARGFSAAQVLTYLASQADNVVVGRTMGAAPLGVYSRSFSLMARPSSLIANSVKRVLYPTMARIQDDRPELTRLYAKMTVMLALVSLAPGFVFTALAPEIVIGLLGPQWHGAIAPFAILSVGMVFRVGNQGCDALNLAVGNVSGRVVPKVAFLASVIGFAWIGSRWGLEGISWGVLLANFVHMALLAASAIKHVDLTWGGYLKLFVGPLLLSVLAGLAAHFAASGLRELTDQLWLPLIGGFAAAALATLAFFLLGGNKMLGGGMEELLGRALKKVRKKLKLA